MKQVFLLLTVLALWSNGNGQAFKDIQNLSVDRKIDIASQLVKIVSKFTIENIGNSEAKLYIYALRPEDAKHLAYIGAISDSIPLTVSESKTSQPGAVLYDIVLPSALKAGKTMKLEVETVFTHYLTPHPTEITQSERQLVVYSGNHYEFSPYVSLKQTTRVQLASSRTESYSKNIKPVSQTDSSITYGPYEKISPFAFESLTIHTENNRPFITVSDLKRWIEVSHWGMIAVEENIVLRHTGAKLKGSFSRYEYQRDQNGVSSVKQFRSVLPASAQDVYYRDAIGNVSTSQLRYRDDSVEVDIRPRFPLFGGWKTEYMIGYNVPTYEYLYTDGGDKFVLRMRFLDHILDNMAVDQMSLRIVLPEGSKDIKLKLPYSARRLPDERHYTYLDTTGRPVIVLEKSNLVEQHIQDFEVHYRFQRINMLQEPFLVVGALFILFLVVVFYVRLDFAISWDPKQEARMLVDGIMEKIGCIQDHRTSVYEQYESAINKYKLGKDVTLFQAATKKFNNDHKNDTNEIAELITNLKEAGGTDAVELANEMQKCDKLLKEQLGQHALLAEKMLGGKINRQQFVESEGIIVKKKQELAEKIQEMRLKF